MTEPLARIELSSLDPATVVRVVGQVDLSNAVELETELLEHVARTEACVLDMTDVTYLDSSGLRLLEHVRRATAEAGARFAVVAGPGSVVRELVELVGIAPLLDLHASLQDALASVA